MAQKLGLSKLPTELLLHVAGFLSIKDLSSFSRLSRQFHWHLFSLLFDYAIRTDSEPREQRLVSLFFHALEHDSKLIAEYLIYSPERINLNGYEIFDEITILDTEVIHPQHISSLIIDRSSRHLFVTSSSSPNAMPSANATVSEGPCSLACLRI